MTKTTSVCTCKVLYGDEELSLKEVIARKLPVDNFLDPETVDLTCPLVYEQIKKSALGVFQLEGATAKKWLPKFQPQTIMEISDFTSLARTGPLDAGMMDEYIKVKFGYKEPEYILEKLKDILGDTKSTLIYQEQVLKICGKIAGLSLSEADNIRKAIGKKKADLMAKCKGTFIEGCVKNEVSQEIADKLWSWIDVMSGYSFNLAHAICYSYIAFYTAWVKAHFPVEFFLARLRTCGQSTTEQTEEIKEVVNDTKLHGVKVKPPDVKIGNLDFEINDSNEIVFGMGNIKGIGTAARAKVSKAKKIATLNDFIIFAFENLNKTIVEALIWSGGVDSYSPKRYTVAAEYKALSLLTEKEYEALKKYLDKVPILESLKKFFDVSTRAARKESGKEVPMEKRCISVTEELKKLEVGRASIDMGEILAKEKFYMGVTFSGSEVDLYNTEYSSHNCIDFVEAKTNTKFRFLCVFENVKMHIDKKKNEMAFVSFGDSSYIIDGGVIFASLYAKVKPIVEKGRVVMMAGRKQDNSFLIDDVKEVF